MDNSVILSTTHSLEGYSIIEYKDVISEEVVFANKLISQFKNMVNDFFSAVDSLFYDTELSGTSVAILKAKEYVKDKLRAKAASIGANAVVGIDFETSIGASSTNIRVSINGTAVIVKKLADINREAEEEKRREEEEILRQQKIAVDREKFKDSKNFIYKDHEETLNTFKTAKEIYEYLVSLNIQDEYINSTVLPEIQKISEVERFYGNKMTGALNKLKELTNREK